MKFVRFLKGSETAFGLIEDSVITEISDSPLHQWEKMSATYQLNDVKLQAPGSPAKILAMAENFRSHLHGAPEHEQPEPFWKTPNAIVGPGGSIILPREAGRVDAEGELVGVIGKRCSKVEPEHALDYIFGYTCGNDVSAREWQRGDRQWWRGKSSDTFAPIGPVIATGIDPSKQMVITRINGKEVQKCSVSEMIFDFAAVVSFISRCVTLEPGDLIFSGTSGTPAELHDGDVVQVESPGIGVLENSVVLERA